MVKEYYLYILASFNGVLYTGVTNNLERRIFEHKNKLIKGFTSKYNCNKLVYFESSIDIKSILEREKQIKNWNRTKKESLINRINPMWKDLSETFYL